jgi:menaquinone-dependent protoporphyrinogen IX oxidase
MEIKRIVENLQYQQDQDSNLIQVADLAASAFSAKYNRKNNKFFTKYKEFLRKSPGGRIEGFGLKIFP